MRKAMLLLAVCGLVGLLWAADNPFVGTWKANLSKSKSASPVTVKSEIVTIEPIENGLKITDDSITAQGKTEKIVYSSKFDSKDYPVTGGTVPPGGTYALKKIDSNTTEGVIKVNGKTQATIRWVVSNAGKTMTGTYHLKDPKGQDVTTIAVYDKQ
jgi:hypothetical protein